jgi:hypothetical protein
MNELKFTTITEEQRRIIRGWIVLNRFWRNRKMPMPRCNVPRILK